MKRFIEGEDRGQWTLLPECLDDWVGEDNPISSIAPPKTSTVAPQAKNSPIVIRTQKLAEFCAGTGPQCAGSVR